MSQDLLNKVLYLELGPVLRQWDLSEVGRKDDQEAVTFHLKLFCTIL